MSNKKIDHDMGISYNMQGQAIAERSYRWLQQQLKLQKGKRKIASISFLNKGLYALIFKNNTKDDLIGTECHCLTKDKGVKPKMMWKDVIIGKALAFHLLIWGPEYAYVFFQKFWNNHFEQLQGI